MATEILDKLFEFPDDKPWVDLPGIFRIKFYKCFAGHWRDYATYFNCPDYLVDNIEYQYNTNSNRCIEELYSEMGQKKGRSFNVAFIRNAILNIQELKQAKNIYEQKPIVSDEHNQASVPNSSQVQPSQMPPYNPAYIKSNDLMNIKFSELPAILRQAFIQSVASDWHSIGTIFDVSSQILNQIEDNHPRNVVRKLTDALVEAEKVNANFTPSFICGKFRSSLVKKISYAETLEDLIRRFN
jgi:hypothetical protein